MAFLRYQLFMAYAVAFFSAWYYALSFRDVIFYSPLLRLWILYAPLWAVVAIGTYALSRLILGVMLCKNRPDAAAELDKDIKEARRELEKKGIK